MTSWNPGTPDITTVSGRFFEFLDPKPEQIDIGDIAHGLAFTCRFAAQCRVFYSVAQHSVLASELVREEHALAALLHDAAEAYLCDIPGPLKRYLADYRLIEERVQRAILERFGLSPELPVAVKRIDAQLLVTEGRDVAPQGWDFTRLDHLLLKQPIIPWTPEHARILFLRRFEMLGGAL